MEEIDLAIKVLLLRPQPPSDHLVCDYARGLVKSIDDMLKWAKHCSDRNIILLCVNLAVVASRPLEMFGEARTPGTIYWKRLADKEHPIVTRKFTGTANAVASFSHVLRSTHITVHPFVDDHLVDLATTIFQHAVTTGVIAEVVGFSNIQRVDMCELKFFSLSPNTVGFTGLSDYRGRCVWIVCATANDPRVRTDGSDKVRLNIGDCEDTYIALTNEERATIRTMVHEMAHCVTRVNVDTVQPSDMTKISGNLDGANFQDPNFIAPVGRPGGAGCDWTEAGYAVVSHLFGVPASDMQLCPFSLYLENEPLE